VLPAVMKEAVGIDQDVVFVGAHRRIEIWNPGQWDVYRSEHEKEYGQKMGLVAGEVFGL
jgi:DNA-binding transcriptional regulator/RsmH inhibitor MraZ